MPNIDLHTTALMYAMSTAGPPPIVFAPRRSYVERVNDYKNLARLDPP
jgi:hypothetical protein